MDAVIAKSDVEANHRLRLAQEKSNSEVEVERMRGLREVAKEAQKTCKELSKARTYAQKEQSRMQELNISPSVITLVQTMIDKLVEFESHTGALSP